ncbi:hypothetical protein OFAG_01147 [Oxalobacter formigenes HOxBLS]|uniref:Uncharacterized protein n=2 Tax=Oxalobacter paraformigenes TaxID=556268 RepID=C3X458_9BURK|nr:hypothetical protein [Oxalobacter paraformigenes]EEO27994.2 hypothetical protein OFAG_01147 [Oxalobacter paraformigenes]
MDEWTKLTKERIFISDLGENRMAEIGGTVTVLGRYAVWAPAPDGHHHRVVEVGGNCAELMEKYGVPQERVLRLLTAEACHG